MNNKLNKRLTVNYILGGQGGVEGSLHKFGASFPKLPTF